MTYCKTWAGVQVRIRRHLRGPFYEHFSRLLTVSRPDTVRLPGILRVLPRTARRLGDVDMFLLYVYIRLPPRTSDVGRDSGRMEPEGTLASRLAHRIPSLNTTLTLHRVLCAVLSTKMHFCCCANLAGSKIWEEMKSEKSARGRPLHLGFLGKISAATPKAACSPQCGPSFRRPRVEWGKTPLLRAEGSRWVQQLIVPTR